MAKWEREALSKCTILPLFFARFIDDMFILWLHGKEKFLSFFEILNTHLPGIKLTYVYSETSIDFLDITIYKGTRFKECSILDTKVFFKPTDTHQLLHTKSFHPRHVFTSVIKSQVLRFSRICNNRTDFDDACSVLFRSIRTRGYSIRSLRRIKSEISEARHDNRTLGLSGNFGPCLSKRCMKCKYAWTCNDVNINGHSYSLKHKLDCNSTGFIYVIKCFKMQYSLHRPN